MKKIINSVGNFFKCNYKKILSFALTFAIAITFVLCSNTKVVNADDGVNESGDATVEDIKEFYNSYYTDAYFENNFNYRFKGSNANFNFFAGFPLGTINFGIGNYTYQNDFLTHEKYELYDGYGSGNGFDKVAQYQRSLNSTTHQTTFYTNKLSNYLVIEFSNVVIPFLDSDYNDFIGIDSVVFSNSLNAWLENLYLYSNTKSAIPYYSMSYSLNAYDVQSSLNDSYNVYGDVITISTESTQYKSLSTIITTHYILDSFNYFVNSLPTRDYKILLPYYQLSELCTAQFNYSHYFILPNLRISISLPNETESVFYFVEEYLDDYYIYDNEFLEYLNLIAYGELNVDNVDIIFGRGYYSGYETGYTNGQNFGYEEGYTEGYKYGYNVGFDSASEYSNPFIVILDIVSSFLNFEIFPEFKLYYILLFAFGISIFGLILKFAMGG